MGGYIGCRAMQNAITASEFVPSQAMVEGGRWVCVETNKGFSEWPKMGDWLYRREPCDKGEECEIRGYCTFYHTEEEREVARRLYEEKKRAKKREARARYKENQYNRQYNELQGILRGDS